MSKRDTEPYAIRRALQAIDWPRDFRSDPAIAVEVGCVPSTVKRHRIKHGIPCYTERMRAAAAVVRGEDAPGDASPRNSEAELDRLRSIVKAEADESQEMREALGAHDDEYVVDAARRVAGELDRMALDLAAVSRAVTERRPGETLAQAVTRARVERDAAVCEVSRLRAEAADSEAVVERLRVQSEVHREGARGLQAQLAQAQAELALLREVQP